MTWWHNDSPRGVAWLILSFCFQSSQFVADFDEFLETLFFKHGFDG